MYVCMAVSVALDRKSTGSHGLRKRTGVALLLAAAGISCAVGIADLRTSQRLIAAGMTTRAGVTGKHIERSRHSQHRYIDIEYTTAAGQVRGRDDIASALYERLKVGDTIAVRYLPAHPDVHAIGATTRLDTFMLWFAGLWIVLAGVYWLFGT